MSEKKSVVRWVPPNWKDMCDTQFFTRSFESASPEDYVRVRITEEPERYYCIASGSDKRFWRVCRRLGNGADVDICAYSPNHPSPESAARAEAARLNVTEEA